jgi:hypothetical protein
VREIFLGDSYDLVKRFWAQTLRPIAPLYTHPKFVPANLISRYTALTSIPLFGPLIKDAFGLFLDPHTGICLPNDRESLDGATASHVSPTFLVRINKELEPKYAICFDQAFHRTNALSRQGQMRAKAEFLRAHNITSFYYVSHAPFLFMSSSPDTTHELYSCLLSAGLPSSRFEFFNVLPATIRMGGATYGNDEQNR